MGCIYGHSSSEKIDARLAAERAKAIQQGVVDGIKFSCAIFQKGLVSTGHTSNLLEFMLRWIVVSPVLVLFQRKCIYLQSIHGWWWEVRFVVAGWHIPGYILCYCKRGKAFKATQLRALNPMIFKFLNIVCAFLMVKSCKIKIIDDWIKSHILVFIFCFLLVKLPRLLVKSQFLLAQSPFLLMTSPFSHGFQHFPRWTKHLQPVSCATRQVSRVSPGAIACITCQCGGALHQKLW